MGESAPRPKVTLRDRPIETAAWEEEQKRGAGLFWLLLSAHTDNDLEQAWTVLSSLRSSSAGPRSPSIK